MLSLPNIEYTGGRSVTVQSNTNEYELIKFRKNKDYFVDNQPCNEFISACERSVRNNPLYKVFESYIVKILGINYCQVNPNIVEGDATIQMHHGPLFTLYDYCKIILFDFLNNDKRVTTFSIAKQVLREHFDMKVQVVMVAVTNHEAIHNRDIFLNVKQGIGDLNGFIQKYSNALDDEYKYRIWRYIQLCKESDSFDYGILDVEEVAPLIEL